MIVDDDGVTHWVRGDYSLACIEGTSFADIPAPPGAYLTCIACISVLAYVPRAIEALKAMRKDVKRFKFTL